ncbi:MAG: DUF167 domain-containing protein [Acidimicrobiales bacterium]
MTAPARFEIRVKPGSSAAAVGGTWGEADALVVAVTAPAVDGRANDAVIKLLASVLKVRRRQLSIVHGATHRSKVVEVVDPPEGLDDLLDRRRAGR